MPRILCLLALLNITIPLASSLSTVPPGTSVKPKKYFGGSGIGRFTIDESVDSWQCAYDMVLVERIQGKPKTEGGLFVPEEELPKLHLCRGECGIL